jgi:hypothetical protein
MATTVWGPENSKSGETVGLPLISLFGLQPWDVPALMPNDPLGDMWESFDFNAAPRLGPPLTVPM